MSDKGKLADAVIEKAGQDGSEKKLTCADAFELAKRFDVKIIEIGRICNQVGIKIRKCQLGCFP